MPQLVKESTTTQRDNAIRPFRMDVPEEDRVDLRRRIAAACSPDKETVSERSQGVHLAKLRPLVEYWGTDYDRPRVEARLNLRLGYSRYVSQGGDWGAIISELLAVQAPEGLLGIHVHMPGTSAISIPHPRSSRIGRRSLRPAAILLPRRLRLRGDDEPEPADDRLRPGGFAGRDGGVLLRQVRGVDR